MCYTAICIFNKEIIAKINEYTFKLFVKMLKVVGLINIQYAVKNSTVYVIEANPRASLEYLFSVSKTIKVPLAKEGNGR